MTSPAPVLSNDDDDAQPPATATTTTWPPSPAYPSNDKDDNNGHYPSTSTLTMMADASPTSHIPACHQKTTTTSPTTLLPQCHLVMMTTIPFVPYCIPQHCPTVTPALPHLMTLHIFIYVVDRYYNIRYFYAYFVGVEATRASKGIQDN